MLPDRLNLLHKLRKHTPSNTTNSLCTACASIPVRSLFLADEVSRPTIANGNKINIPHDYLDDVLYRATSKTCQLCRLVCHAIHTSLKIVRGMPPPSPSEPLELSDYFDTNTRLRCHLQQVLGGWLHEESRWRKDNRGKKRSYDYKATRIGITLQPDTEKIPATTKTREEGIIALIQLISSDASKIDSIPLFHGRIVDEAVDINRIRSWLKACKEKHTECEDATKNWADVLPPPQNLRVIDTLESRILKLEEGSGYLALSYVWGQNQEFKLLKSNVEEWSVPGNLPHPLPKTIHDAIELTKMLGERYLWVDSLCIVQDDDDIKQDQIGQMDRVYGSASFTIVAADGNTAEAGLPGLTPRQRMQMVEVIQGLTLAVVLPTLLDTLSFSFWNSRGWTYQERLLSRKAVYFTGHQIYWQCNRDTWCEDVYAEKHSRMQSMQSYSSFGPQRLDFNPHPHLYIPHSSFSLYTNLIDDYTARNFSDESDALNAFTGISNVLRHQPGTWGFVAGLPVCNFDDAIVWLPKGPIERCRQFPSWSWAGWTGSGVTMRPRVGDSLVEEWFVVCDPTVKADEEQRIRLPPTKPTFWTLQPTPHSEQLGLLQAYNDADVLSRFPSFRPESTTKRALTNAKGLEFWVSSCIFHFTGEENLRPLWGETERPFYSRVYVYDSKGKAAGTALLPKSMAMETAVQGLRIRCEFIALSRADVQAEKYADGNVFDRDIKKALNVLMIERGEVVGTMCRVTVGMIHEDAWNAEGPKREYIKLV
ncbi:heterokaryon incompatibility protein-domain-containing protein [Trichophaea hybrida]|nr:heterokaryon incompatibility protein-domain-containing protein [Trichophaea hybrida]